MQSPPRQPYPAIRAYEHGRVKICSGLGGGDAGGGMGRVSRGDSALNLSCPLSRRVRGHDKRGGGRVGSGDYRAIDKYRVRCRSSRFPFQPITRFETKFLEL
jgi:hypothetical protein